MASLPLLLLFVFSRFVVLHSAEGDKGNSKCPQLMDCGKLGQISFPFANETHRDCGLCVVNCRDTPPKIQLEKRGRWFEIESISQSSSIIINDAKLQQFLEERNCEYFDALKFPKSPSISFPINDSHNLSKCNISAGSTSFEEFSNLTCRSYTIYNGTSNDSLPQCSIIKFPVINNQASNDLFTQLSAKFSIQAAVSLECASCHFSRKGICESDNEGKFLCANATEPSKSKGKKNLALKLGLGIGGLAMFITLSCYIIWLRCKRRTNALNFHLRNTSSFSKSDLEVGSVYFGLPIFSYRELEEATNYFASDKELGDGGFGTVYYGKLRDGREVAVKRLYEHNYKRVAQFMNEVEILTRLRHKNLVSLYGCTSRRSRELLLVYEYIPNGTVADHIHGDRAQTSSLTWPIRMSIAVETASALAYLHASDTIHRDVKTNNILLDNNFSVKVADFGLSRLFPNDVTHVSTAPQGTPGYVDPEYHQCYQLTDKSDVYSFGVVLIELISSMPAVDISRHRQEINLANLAINKIQKCAFDELIDPLLGYKSDEEVTRMTTSVAELAFQCLQQDKDLRPSMDEVLEELKRIQDGDFMLENLDERHSDNGAQISKHPPASPTDCDEVVLLKNTHLPTSPDSVTDKWTSISTTPNVSS